MTTYYDSNRSLLGRLLFWGVIGIVAIVAIKIALAIAGVVIGLGFLVLFTVGPILLLGWLVVKAARYFSRPDDAVI